jgi:hypothetical protein
MAENKRWALAPEGCFLLDQTGTAHFSANCLVVPQMAENKEGR